MVLLGRISESVNESKLSDANTVARLPPFLRALKSIEPAALYPLAQPGLLNAVENDWMPTSVQAVVY